MLITRSPLRITLGGGGTDLESYYSKYEGFLISAAIDKYVYITINKPFQPGIFLKYSKIETAVKDINSIEHPIIRESIRLVNPDMKYLEMSSITDIPSGTGLGSSGSFTTALLKALHSYENNLISQNELAEQACKIEIEKLREPIGKQDQYIAAYGGITCFEINTTGNVKVSPLKISKETLYDLEDNLLLFFTGYSRAASSILKEQNDKSKVSDEEMITNLHFVKELGLKSKLALENGDLHQFGELMNTHWEHKKKRSGIMSNPKIDDWYNLALENGAVGGKLIGAGGGGFLMFYAENKYKLRKALIDSGLEEVRFKFDFEGTKLIT
ncbi:MAG: galactokinase [bacterium]